ncbi:hypothetical protein E2C01_049624 [Portunus trituberculatus]|uniref:Uncharacterized protein n=1 Tax=Portunus trituberculatus TaxID=210409 RepID=A0A5B7G634_PORTR|nr:hypothetical protein [Portunus trituberculatus]
MRKDNPHISKRRGGRKATHRRFSMQVLRRDCHQTRGLRIRRHETVEVSAGDSMSSIRYSASPGMSAN